MSAYACVCVRVCMCVCVCVCVFVCVSVCVLNYSLFLWLLRALIAAGREVISNTIFLTGFLWLGHFRSLLYPSRYLDILNGRWMILWTRNILYSAEIPVLSSWGARDLGARDQRIGVAAWWCKERRREVVKVGPTGIHNSFKILL